MFLEQTAFENVVCETSVILCRPHCFILITKESTEVFKMQYNIIALNIACVSVLFTPCYWLDNLPSRSAWEHISYVIHVAADDNIQMQSIK